MVGFLQFMWNPDFISVAHLCRALAHDLRKSLGTHIFTREALISSAMASLGRSQGLKPSSVSIRTMLKTNSGYGHTIN